MLLYQLTLVLVLQSGVSTIQIEHNNPVRCKAQLAEMVEDGKKAGARIAIARCSPTIQIDR